MIRTAHARYLARMRRPIKSEFVLPAVAALCSLAAYLITMAPSAFPLDSSEMAAGAATLGIVHSPGYPVYLLLTHLFTHLPVGDLAYRANLASAVFSALSVGLLVSLVRDITGRSLAAFVAGLSFAYCFYTWSLSVVAEVYTLQALFLVSILSCAWRWRQNGRNSHFVCMAFLLGLAAANNPATILWWPGLFLLLWRPVIQPDLDRRVVLKAALALSAGLAFVLYAPIRSLSDPAVNYIGQYDGQGNFLRLDLTRIDNLFWYLSGRQFGWAFLAYSGPELVEQAGRFAHQLFGAFLGAGVVVAAWGALRLLRKQPVFATGLALAALLHALFFVAYRAPDKETMFLPVYLVVAILLGVGAARVEVVWPRAARLGLPLLILALLVVNRSYANVRDVTGPRDVAEARLSQAEPDAFYLAVWGDAAAMEYLQVAEGLRPDVNVINILMIAPDTRNELVSFALDNDRTVYSTFYDPALRQNYQLEAISHGFIVGGDT